MAGFQEAKREKLKALIAMMGASGSGKTFSSLVLAKGIIQGMFPDLEPNSGEFWRKIGVVDTEHDRSKIYADVEKHGVYFGSFLHMNISKPFTPDKYIEAIREAENAGIEVLILDSTTHLWKYLLEWQKDLGGRYQDWKDPDKLYNDFIDAFTQTDMHIIATMRSKQSYALESSETGKLQVAKLGEKPVQRDDFEYEFLLAFMLDQTHKAHATKDNTPLFEELGEFQIKEEHGKMLVDWLDKGIDVKAAERKEKEKFYPELEKYLTSENEQMKVFAEELQEKGKRAYGTDFKHLSLDRMKNALNILKAKETELEKQPTQTQDPKTGAAEPKGTAVDKRSQMLNRIKRYENQESVELNMYITDLEATSKKNYGTGFDRLNEEKLEKVLGLIEERRAKIHAQIEVAKEETESEKPAQDSNSLVLYYHPESNSVVPIEKEDIGEVSEELTLIDDSLKLDVLREIAQSCNIEGISKLKKAELLEAIQGVFANESRTA